MINNGDSPRKRVLSDEEICTLWPHLEMELENPRDILKLGLYTAQRPGEIAAMKWSDIDLEKAIWTQAEMKTDNTFLCPLSPQVIAILETRERRGEYVFHSNYNHAREGYSGDPHTKSTKGARKRLQAKSGVTGWTAHDLRRTARTILSRLQIKPHIRERCLNHSQGKIEKVYDQYDYLDETPQRNPDEPETMYRKGRGTPWKGDLSVITRYQLTGKGTAALDWTRNGKRSWIT